MGQKAWTLAHWAHRSLNLTLPNGWSTNDDQAHWLTVIRRDRWIGARIPACRISRSYLRTLHAGWV